MSTRHSLARPSDPRSYRSRRTISSPRTDPKVEVPESKDPKFFRSFVMKLQCVATWVRFDISFTASQLANHVAKPGPVHCSALHHLMEYLECYPSFKLVYRRVC